MMPAWIAATSADEQIDKHVNCPHRVIFAHVIVQLFSKQDPLLAILTFDEALQSRLRRCVPHGF
jgi:hypothetical protein